MTFNFYSWKEQMITSNWQKEWWKRRKSDFFVPVYRVPLFSFFSFFRLLRAHRLSEFSASFSFDLNLFLTSSASSSTDDDRRTSEKLHQHAIIIIIISQLNTDFRQLDSVLLVEWVRHFSFFLSPEAKGKVFCICHCAFLCLSLSPQQLALIWVNAIDFLRHLFCQRKDE